MYSTGQSKRLKVDGLRKWTALRSKNSPPERQQLDGLAYKLGGLNNQNWTAQFNLKW